LEFDDPGVVGGLEQGKELDLETAAGELLFELNEIA
jgi:hypothetical protein